MVAPTQAIYGPMDGADAVIGGVMGSIGAAAGAVITAWFARRPAKITAEAHAQTSVNEGFAALVQNLMARCDQMAVELEDARGEIRDLIQHLDSLEVLLREAGVPVPMRTRPHHLALVQK